MFTLFASQSKSSCSCLLNAASISALLSTRYLSSSSISSPIVVGGITPESYRPMCPGLRPRVVMLLQIIEEHHAGLCLSESCRELVALALHVWEHRGHSQVVHGVLCPHGAAPHLDPTTVSHLHNPGIRRHIVLYATVQDRRHTLPTDLDTAFYALPDTMAKHPSQCPVRAISVQSSPQPLLQPLGAHRHTSQLSSQLSFTFVKRTSFRRLD